MNPKDNIVVSRGSINNLLLYAARYAHDRNTGASLQVVNIIASLLDNIDDDTKQKLKEESEWARYNTEDWKKLRNLK